MASGKADPILSAFARLQAAAIRLGEADFTEMENRLKPLTGDDNPWRFIAKEYLGLAALKAARLMWLVPRFLLFCLILSFPRVQPSASGG